MIEKTLQEAVDRYKSINKYTKKLMEQGAPGSIPPPPPAAGGDVDPTAGAAPAGGLGDTPDLTGAASGSSIGDTSLPTDPIAGAMPDAGAAGAIPDAGAAAGADTQELDITDLVNMTTNIKKDLEQHTQDNSAVISKMDGAFTKLDDLAHQLSKMDAVMDRIDKLDMKMDSMKQKTPEEKLEMRSLDSYPFNQNPQAFFAKKQDDMRKSGKHEYVLTKDDIENYSKDDIKTSFNPYEENDESFANNKPIYESKKSKKNK